MREQQQEQDEMRRDQFPVWSDTIAVGDRAPVGVRVRRFRQLFGPCGIEPYAPERFRRSDK